MRFSFKVDRQPSSLRFTFLLWLLGGMIGLTNLVAAERELIRDPRVEHGAILIAVQPGKRVPYGVLPGRMQEPPVWDLDQWSSTQPLLAESSQAWPEGVRFSNSAKQVTFGKPGTSEADFSLRVNGSFEYGAHARKTGEPWVHLLLQQELPNGPTLAELETARFHIEARLKSAKKFTTPDYTPSLHAAQFQLFFSVQNLNPKSTNYGQYLWFGIPLYDDRARFPAAYKAKDTGGTQMYIFTPAAKEFTADSAHDGKWVIIDKDLLPLMKEGLEAAWAEGFLIGSKSLADYRIAGMNLGWEVPGIFDVDMQVRKLSLRVK